jgi:hypothetical protein
MIWGKPRRAEDIDIGSKKIRPASLLPETYALGCPDLSPEGKELLFTAETSGGTSEIRVSKNRDGSASTSVTPGADPLWMGTGEEFLYELDGTHPAMFSLATMKFSLLPDPGLGGGETISGKAVSRSTGKVAILYFNEQVRYALAVYNPGESNHRTFMVPAARRVEFETATDRLLVSYDPSVRLSSMTEVDWRSGTSRHLGRYPGLELADALPNGNAELIVLGRQLSSDVWLVQGGTRRRLTSDGRNLTAALSPNGDVLVSKLLDDGRSTIWRQASDGTTRELTSGPNDVSPGFSSDGRSWAYVDYARKSLMLCSAARWTCELLRSDENLPGWPRFSPGGNLLAYVTQSKVPHLTVMSLRDRTTRQISAVHAKCPPEWSSPTTLWELEGTAEQYAWVERDVISGAKTGKRAELGVGHDPEESGCAPPSDRPDSGSLQRVRIESQEKDQLLKVALRR